ncbi:MAG: imidazole glycerol phosphate synthase subunit HisH [Syntrophales bacterium]|nr:imidazole glycerol phosphate synthase subunit HisH [Syntrophales bacterium]
MIAIVDYKAGNLRSVERALKKLGLSCRVTADTREIAAAERIVFPGVGAAGSAMRDLMELGIGRVIKEAFLSGKPILGICLGAQIVLDRSEENETVCLGLVRGEVRRFPDYNAGEVRLKIPHMGWNRIIMKRSHPVLEGIKEDEEMYFVHSYYPSPADRSSVIAETDYGFLFPSVIGCRSLIATQFHLEKSGNAGLRILKNFCEWDGRRAQ